MKKNKSLIINCLFLIPFLFLSYCSKEPKPIEYGLDNCDYCRMLITDPKFGTELINDKGKVYKFDSVECLAAFSSELPDNMEHSIWVTDFFNPNILVESKGIVFLQSQTLRSPMGLNLAGFSKGKNLQKAKAEFGGLSMSWKEVKEFVSTKWKK